MKQKAKLLKERFTGDPFHVLECIERKKTADGGDYQAEDEEDGEANVIKEEERLAAVIAEIETDARIVPQGSYVKLPTGQVNENRNFEGLTVVEAASLYNSSHFRLPTKLPEKPLLQRANLNTSIDFLDSVDEDFPQGSRCLQFERGSGLVILHNLLWLGYVFYCIPGTKKYGSVYAGTGEKNVDLPFML